MKPYWTAALSRVVISRTTTVWTFGSTCLPSSTMAQGDFCSELLATGACSKPNCNSRHDVTVCKPCGVVCYGADAYTAHTQHRKHLAKVTGRSGVFHCPLCKTNINGSRFWENHLRGRRHHRAAAASGVSPEIEPEEPVTLPGYIYCEVCDTNILKGEWNRHPNTPSHQRKLAFAKYEAVMDEAMKDKHGVELSHDGSGVDFGIVDVAIAQRGSSISVKVRNTVPSSRFTLLEVKLSLSSDSRVTSASVEINFTSSCQPN